MICCENVMDISLLKKKKAYKEANFFFANTIMHQCIKKGDATFSTNLVCQLLITRQKTNSEI